MRCLTNGTGSMESLKSVSGSCSETPLQVKTGFKPLFAMIFMDTAYGGVAKYGQSRIMTQDSSRHAECNWSADGITFTDSNYKKFDYIVVGI